MNPNYTYWTMQETDILSKHYPYMSMPALQELLPGRKASSIRRKASQLGLRAYQRTADSLDYIRRNLGRLTQRQMAAELGISPSLMSYRIKRTSIYL